MDRKSRKFFVNLRDFPTFKIEVQFWEYKKSPSVQASDVLGA